MKQIILYIIISIVLISCNKKEAYNINLKWNKAYPEDTFQRNIIGLKWALSYLGSPVANDSTFIKFNPEDSIIKLNIKDLGFSEDASKTLAQLQYQFKNTDNYKANNSFDIGRYVALTFGNPKHYYAIVDISETFKRFKQNYVFSESKGYINNSSVSNVHRIISFSNISKTNNQAFISAEIDSITKDTLEYETMEVMPNGQLKFGVYDVNGNLKDAASREFTRAGTPAKCIWCHEVVVQPLYKTQQNQKGYLDYLKLDDTLTYFNNKLQKYQDKLWVDESFTNKKLHTELELLYISFMEPSAERISKEWQMPLDKVRQKLAHLKTHKHVEFPFLGDLYHRKDIDALAPYKVIKAPKSIRE